MSKPTWKVISHGQEDWEADEDDNWSNLRDKPFPLYELDGDLYDETDLETQFPAAQYDRCLVWVKHSVLGWALYTTVAGSWFLLIGGAGTLATIMKEVTTEGITIVAGTGKMTFRMPFAMTVTEVRASLVGASSSGAVVVDINQDGTTILSTKLSIDQGEKTSETAATPAVISDSALPDDSEITIDIDSAGTGAHGLKVTINGARAS